MFRHITSSRTVPQPSVCTKWLCMLLSLLMLLCTVCPAFAAGQEIPLLRVGYFAFDGYHNMDQDGTRSGYGYELLHLIARYTNVRYNYLGYENTLEESLEMLAQGKIDMVSAIKKTPDRERLFAFSDRSVGFAATILTVKAGNTDIISGDYSTYNGLRIGVMKDGTRETEMNEFAFEHGFDYLPVYFDNMPDMAAALQNGEVDALVTSSLRVFENEWVIDSFNESPIYIAMRKDDQATIDSINYALDRMEMEEHHWRTDLNQKYYSFIQSTQPFLTETERIYLKEQNESGRVYRVLVNPERYPYSYVQDGQIVGIMADLFELIANRVGIRYEWIIPADREDYANRMINKETDICIDITPDYDSAEKSGYNITDMYLSAPFSWIRRSDSTGNIQLAARLMYVAYTPAQYAYKNAYHEIEYQSFLSEQECLQSVISKQTDAYCTYTFNAERLVLNDPSGLLMSTVALTENQFAIGVSNEIDVRLVTILNAAAKCIEDWEITGITRRHTSISMPDFSVIEVILNNKSIQMIAVMGFLILVLLIIVINQQHKHQKSLRKTIFAQSKKLDKSLQNMLDVLASAIEFRSSESGAHVYRMRETVLTILKKLKKKYPNDYPFTNVQMEQMAHAAVLHDVGKIAIPDYILNKPGKLTKDEFEIIKQHTVSGCSLLETIPDMQDQMLYQYAWDICRWHHERWDGKGYPDGLAGNSIPVWAQVTAVADAYDALTSPRVHKTAFTREEAVRMITGGECGSFNPQVLDAFVSVADKLYVPALQDTTPLQNAPASRDVTALSLNAFQTFLRSTNAIIFVKDVDLSYRAVSAGFAEIVGTPIEKIICHSNHDIIDDETLRQRYHEEDIRVLTKGETIIGEPELITTKDGHVIYGSTSKYLIHDSQGRVMGILGIIKDVTAQYHAQQHHQLELHYLSQLPDDMYFFIYIDIVNWHVVAETRQEINGTTFREHPTAEAFAKASKETIVDKHDMAYSFYRNFNSAALHKLYESNHTTFVMEYMRQMPNGQKVWVRDELNFMINPNTGHLCMTLGVYDIQQKKVAELRLIAQAQHDELTGLFNRASCRTLITDTLHRNENIQHAMFMIDIDNFKLVNDTFGHIVGDQFLVRIAQIMRFCFPETDLVGRIGGDEFIVLMTNITDFEHVQQKAQQLNRLLAIGLENMLDAMAAAAPDAALDDVLNNVIAQLLHTTPVAHLNPVPHPRVSVSIGVSFFPEDGNIREELYARADAAMYHSKRSGKNQVCFFRDIPQ